MPTVGLARALDGHAFPLDEASAKSMWLEPWRELARTITFNAQHIFVSRRLVRLLRGKGRLSEKDIDSALRDVRLALLEVTVAPQHHFFQQEKQQ